MHISLATAFVITTQMHTMCEHIVIYEEDCEVGRVLGVCESGGKGGQEDDNKTEGRHGRISNRDGKMEGGTGQERTCKECNSGKVEDVDH